MRARLLVDVDGVVNGLQTGTPRAGLKRVEANGYPITYDPMAGDWLLKLAKDHDAELTWCTTWQELANEHIAPLIGLPQDLPVIILYPPHFKSGVGETKAHSIRKYMDQHGELPFVWLEDMSDAVYWARTYCGSVPHKVVLTNPVRGLQTVDIETADNWLSHELARAAGKLTDPCGPGCPSAEAVQPLPSSG